MIRVVAHNITAPLGSSSAECFDRVVRGESRLRLHEGRWDLPEPFFASLFDDDDSRGEIPSFEQLAIQSVGRALREIPADKGISAESMAASGDTVFIFSTTKGNVALLDNGGEIPAEAFLAEAALSVNRHFGNPNRPVVVSNACISGVCAQIAAKRMLDSGRYRYAVVCGVEVMSKFIVSGFQSFKALSTSLCRPYDADRTGLNLGEAAATIIFERTDDEDSHGWFLERGAIRNDANHISGPSRTGEGSFRVLRTVIKDTDTEDIAFVNAHGTATLYNDEMEAIAIDRAGLSRVPVNSLKGCFGHTMGAAGVLECIMSMQAVERGVILPTRGFSRLGVSREITVADALIKTEKKRFVKLMSGFGGCNAGVMYHLR